MEKKRDAPKEKRRFVSRSIKSFIIINSVDSFMKDFGKDHEIPAVIFEKLSPTIV